MQPASTTGLDTASSRIKERPQRAKRRGQSEPTRSGVRRPTVGHLGEFETSPKVRIKMARMIDQTAKRTLRRLTSLRLAAAVIGLDVTVMLGEQQSHCVQCQDGSSRRLRRKVDQ